MDISTSPAIGPINIGGGALISQISIIAILFVGSLILRPAADTGRLGERHPYHNFAWIILAFALVTLIPLTFSELISGSWRPLLGLGGNVGFSRAGAMAVMFLGDTLCVTILVGRTGGSSESPFQALYFLLPPLAIFLREPLGRLLLYVSLLSLSFTFFIFRPEPQTRFVNTNPWFRMAYWFVAIASFMLATYIGYVTRAR
jgi:hypothetical protein